MPTIANSRLPTPNGWDEFEDICRSSFALRLASPNLVRHGRQGQKQDGVDIYGVDSVGNMIGVQCKNTISGITENLVRSECANAESFSPSLSELYIATTAERDTKIQLFARNFSDERRKKSLFPVHVIFWPDITSDLGRDESVARQHYPQFFTVGHSNPQQLARSNDVARMQNAFSQVDFSFISSELRWGAKYIHSSIIDGLEHIKSTSGSPTFIISDISLRQNFDHLIFEWERLAEFVGQGPYNDRYGTLIFHMPGDFIKDPDEQALYEQINTQIDSFQHAIRSFCSFVSANYPEIRLR